MSLDVKHNLVQDLFAEAVVSSILLVSAFTSFSGRMYIHQRKSGSGFAKGVSGVLCYCSRPYLSLRASCSCNQHTMHATNGTSYLPGLFVSVADGVCDLLESQCESCLTLPHRSRSAMPRMCSILLMFYSSVFPCISVWDRRIDLCISTKALDGSKCYRGCGMVCSAQSCRNFCLLMSGQRDILGLRHG